MPIAEVVINKVTRDRELNIRTREVLMSLLKTMIKIKMNREIRVFSTLRERVQKIYLRWQEHLTLKMTREIIKRVFASFGKWVSAVTVTIALFCTLILKKEHLYANSKS